MQQICRLVFEEECFTTVVNLVLSTNICWNELVYYTLRRAFSVKVTPFACSVRWLVVLCGASFCVQKVRRDLHYNNNLFTKNEHQT